MNKVIDSMLAHRSIRSYTDRTVSDEDLNSIIRAVQAAPNWVNLQLVSIIAVKNTDHRRRLAELCGNQVHLSLIHISAAIIFSTISTASSFCGQGLPYILQTLHPVQG